MSPQASVLAVTHDAGGARALIPVVRWLRRKRVSTTAVVAGPSAGIWKREDPSATCITVRDSIDIGTCKRLCQRLGVRVLLSASGLYNLMEHTFREAARILGIPIVAVTDSWFFYAERYERQQKGRRTLSWPDWVCVPYRLTAKSLQRSGFSPRRLILTGSPNLEASVSACRRLEKSSRSSWRSRIGVRRGEWVVVFFSDPHYVAPDGRPLTGPGGYADVNGRWIYGYSSVSILATLLDELERACRLHNRRCTLIVKPHPMEHVPSLEPLVKRVRHPNLRTLIETRGNAAQWIARSDIVMGMMSTALLEAALAGRPSASIQIGLIHQKDVPCLAKALGYTRVLYSRATLRRILNNLWRKHAHYAKPKPKSPLRVRGSARRVGTVVLRSLRKAAP